MHRLPYAHSNIYFYYTLCIKLSYNLFAVHIIIIGLDDDLKHVY